MKGCGCRNNSPRAACGSKVRDQWMDGQCGCKTRQDTGGCRLDPRTYQSSAADDLGERDRQSRTRKTARLVLLALVPTSKLPPLLRTIESANGHSIKQEFFNRIRRHCRRLRSYLLLHLVGALRSDQPYQHAGRSSRIVLLWAEGTMGHIGGYPRGGVSAAKGFGEKGWSVSLSKSALMQTCEARDNRSPVPEVVGRVSQAQAGWGKEQPHG